jgi:hypothetical protein
LQQAELTSEARPPVSYGAISEGTTSNGCGAANRSKNDSQRSDKEAHWSDKEAQRSNEEAQSSDKEAQSSDKEARRSDEEAGSSDTEAQSSNKEAQRSDEEAQRSDEEIGRSEEEAQGFDEEAQNAEPDSLGGPQHLGMVAELRREYGQVRCSLPTVLDSVHLQNPFPGWSHTIKYNFIGYSGGESHLSK